MKPPGDKLFWKAVSHGNRFQEIRRIKSAIGDSGGSILNANFFSDIGLGLVIEIEAADIEPLYKSLEGMVKLNGIIPEGAWEDPEVDWHIHLHVSFAGATGDLTQEIPMVPG